MSKICVICNRKIIERKERWVRLTDFNKKQQVGETFYHLECWRDRYNIGNSLKKQKMYNEAKQALSKIFNFMGNQSKQNQVYEIGGT